MIIDHIHNPFRHTQQMYKIQGQVSVYSTENLKYFNYWGKKKICVVSLLLYSLQVVDPICSLKM